MKLGTLPFLFLAALASAAAQADSFRCGSDLVSVGATAAEVLAKCGPPASKQTIVEDVIARNANGGTRKIGEAFTERWRYDRGKGQYPAVLTVRDEVVRAIEFEK